MTLTDTHAHIYLDVFDDDRDAMMQRAIDAGVERLFLPNIDLSSIDAVKGLAARWPTRVWPMMGLHPCSVQENWSETLDAIEEELRGDTKYVAVGEIGIDLYWNKSALPWQVEAFKRQIGWAKELDLPIVIHCRDSFDEIFEVLAETQDGTLRGVLHCFTGNEEQAERTVELGMMLGLGGVLTFKNSGVDKAVGAIPMGHIVLETDSPYLAPTPHRGKRNESAYVALVAEKLAEVKGLTLSEVTEVTTENSKRLFGV